MKLQNQFMLVIFVGLLIAGCAASNQTKQKKQQHSYSLVQVSNSNLQLPQHVMFSWLPQKRPVLGNTRIDRREISNLLDVSFKQELKKRGYLWNDSHKLAQYYITYVAIAGDSVTEADINRTFKINPGLSSATYGSNSFEKGSLIVDIVDSRSGQSAWRVALQANLDRDDELDARQQRIKNAVRYIVSKIP